MGSLKSPKNTILEWFLKASRSGRDQMTVPPYIQELSCGCKREVNQKLFTIIQCSDGCWKHYGCKVLDLPKTDLHCRFENWDAVKNSKVVVFGKR